MASQTAGGGPMDATAMLLLVILLALKVVFRSSEGRFIVTLNRLLNVGIVPLLILFVARVVPGMITGLAEVF